MVMCAKNSRVYSYVRFSTPEQAAGHSLQRQMDYARKYAEENGLVLDETLTLRDEGLSAYHQQHLKNGALGIFLKAVDEGKVLPGSVLILEGLDRLSRSEPIQSQAILSQIVNAGITVVTASDSKIYNRENLRKNPMDLVYSLLVMIRAHEESATKALRVKQSIKAKINQWIDTGKGPIIHLGSDPFWLSMNEQKNGFDLRPEMVDVVKFIVMKYKKGCGVHKIASELNKRFTHHCKHHTKNCVWKTESVRDLIRNRSLIGERYFNLDNEKYIIKDYYPSIISVSEFLELQHFINTRATTKAQSSIPSFLTGMRLAYCGYCGRNMIGQNYIKKIGEKGFSNNCFRRIMCSRNAGGGKCRFHNKSTSIVCVENALLRYCADFLDFSVIAGEVDDRKELQLKVSQNRIEQDVITEKLNRMVDQFSLMEKVPVIFVKKVNDLEQQQARLAEEYESMQAELSVSNTNNQDVAERWKQISTKAEELDEEARLVIRQLIKRTFARIDVFLFGFDGNDANKRVDLVLQFHNKVRRILEIDKKTGEFSVKTDFRDEVIGAGG
ncbi:recombinase family protein [Kistimonas scapharcae]|uniref:Recombinase family protein n=1 Tax=Kistimonas scapharcae TaxID=1036133 RepID=A0ABP8V6X2_9GAMM